MLKNLDLNLLLALDALATEGSVTGAALRLGITQPAMSNALRRLRGVVGDPLFVRQGRGLVPTARLQRMGPVVRGHLAALETALLGEVPFDPSQARGLIRLGLSDYWHDELLPRLLRILEKEAPGVDLVVTGTGETSIAGELGAGTLDMAIFLFPRAAPGVHSERIVADTYAGIVRRGHPGVGRAMDLDDFARLRHIEVSHRGPWADRAAAALRARGLTPRYVVRNAQIRVALEVVSRTDCLSVLPSRVARQGRRRFPVRLVGLPFGKVKFELGLYWHSRTEHDPMHAWLRKRIIPMAREVYLDG